MKKRTRNILSLRLLSYILVFSTFLSLINTGIQLYDDYRSDFNKLRLSFEYIEKTHIKTLANHIWKIDKEQLLIEMNGILAVPDIKYIEVYEIVNSESILIGKTGSSIVKAPVRKEILLYLDEHGEALGKLKVTASKSSIYKRLQDKVLLILVIQTIKTSMTSMFMLFLFHMLIMRHIAKLEHDFGRMALGQMDEPIYLNRKNKAKDLLDSLVESINHTRVQIKTSIDNLKQSQKLVSNSLKEKEILLQEIHHRVKNNLQIIASLLNLQVKEENSTEVNSILKDNIARVYTMSTIHENLYQSDDLSEINIKYYLNTLAALLFEAYNVDSDQVSIHIEGIDLKISINIANPLALTFNEMISNSLKYAFPDSRAGNIRIKILEKHENQVLFEYSDDGIGFPPPAVISSSESLGLYLIQILVERQLQGSLEKKDGPGTRYHIEIKV